VSPSSSLARGSLAALLALLLVANFAQAQGRGFGRRGPGGDRGDAARYGWLSDFTQAKELARKTGKPLLVVLRCVP